MRYKDLSQFELIKLCESIDSIMENRLDDEAKRYFELQEKTDEMRLGALGYMLAAGFVLDVMRNTNTGKHFNESFEKYQKAGTASSSSSEPRVNQ